ncbi:LLM class flavin-dependent oxidoreductase [Mycolicibacterium brumae]|uniref:LLM class flavin-dependent oxidoreductase n=1 Tax=Mycolicibacterium brumae TaxID=85968 RepID=A0A2G5P9M0_9MYCO|nr:LLM class flavin-dependent oxidoreductase [Mycolicibacterium brumae]MCV7191299.1 LLM class flavin-dependent oxidoreductase [Mycolicibacterium brumae]PIB74594.1 LLM class flavin-dependent oxidoreductase [Mycolicibacterium brumae]UWW09603.1 LLM class flavin-dependent oxidoreductase [Mycolicibacterium brumae]
MDVGLHALGIGTGAERTVIDAVAAAAERTGFATIWAGDQLGEHDDFPPDWLDPFVTLSFVAAATNTIELATGVLPLPERNPVIVARQAASLHRLSNGRLALGVGVGRRLAEFSSLGMPFDQHEEWFAEYVATIRAMWRDDRRFIPVILGGNDEDSLRRVAAWGDGWYGFQLADVEEAAVCTSTLRRLCREAGRDRGDLRLAVSLRDPEPGDLRRLADVGVDQLVLVDSPPADPLAAEAWVAGLARQWMRVLS